MKVELKNIKFSEQLSEETNAFFANIYIDGKKSGYCKNDGCGGCTEYHPYPERKQLFEECEEWLKTQPQINIGTDEQPYMVNCNMENMIDHLFTEWLKLRDKKKLEKQMETRLMWGVPNGYSYGYYNFKKPLNTFDRRLIQQYIDKIKLSLKDGEQILNTNLVGFDL